jgi:hypothetical protein
MPITFIGTGPRGAPAVALHRSTSFRAAGIRVRPPVGIFLA